MSSLPSEVLAALLRVRLGAGSLEETLDDILRIAVDALPGAEDLSTTLVRDDRPFTAGYTGQLALDADEMQYERGYGPCIESATTSTAVVIVDTLTETRWPDYTARVAASGLRSSMSLPLPVQTDVVGALNCYARTPGQFGPESVEVGQELAGYLAVAVANAVTHDDAVQLAEQMRTAMASRAVIDQAKGVIMAQNRCDDEAAFAVLSRASQNRNVKLRDLAADIVAGVTRPLG